MKILASTCFIGDTGYNNHARDFFTALNKYHEVKIRNWTVGKTWSNYSDNCHDSEPYLTKEMQDMLILQTLKKANNSYSDYPIYGYDNHFEHDVHIILADVNHPYFLEEKKGYTIGYNVWETTHYPKDFFNKILKYDQFWVVSEWQKQCLIAQGYPSHKIFVVPEGVNGDVFKPCNAKNKKDFVFCLFGRWEYRKSTTEIIRAFNNVFSKKKNVKLLLSADNPYADDGFNSTEERLKEFNLVDNNLKILHFPIRDQYINYLQQSDVFLSCARSEGWNLPLIEAMACGTPSIYSNWGGQLEFAKERGVPVNVLHEVPASNQNPNFTGNYIEPDYKDLEQKMLEVYNNYSHYKNRAVLESKKIREIFTWDNAAKIADDILKKGRDFVFVTCCDSGYMPLTEQLVKSVQQFSNAKIIVYGIDCEVPFNYPCLIKRTLTPPKKSIHDKWYWKQYACIESIKENFDNYIWIDGDAIVNYNIDNIQKYFNEIENYPLPDIHRNEEFYGWCEINGEKITQSFNQFLFEKYKIKTKRPYKHICLYVYNKKCLWWFNEIINTYQKESLEDYRKLFLWNDEGIDNFLRSKYDFNKYLPLSNFDTSGYDGDLGQTNKILENFYTFWNKKGPYNFNKVFGFQYIPKNKSDILYFHGNKNLEICEKMISFINHKKNNSFYNSEEFFVAPNTLKNLGSIKNEQGSTMHIANKYGWDYAIYHEIYNLLDYYLFGKKRIQKGDVVVDLGGNIGVFNRWAYSEGASKVISFEPDKRYYNLLSLNADPRSVLLNAAASEKIGETYLYESEHLGGSTLMAKHLPNKYKVRTYTLDYLFDSGLIDKIDFLKMDIEGAEQMAFNGISDENLNKVKYIAVEYHNAVFNHDEELRSSLIKRLNKLGFNSYLQFLDSAKNLQYIYFYK